MTTEEKDAEIERLKGELAEALLLMEQGRECLRQLVALSNVNAETRKMLRYLGNTFNLFLQKHTPPLNCGSAAAGESTSHSGGGVVFERYVISEAGKMSVERPETGKSALREVPTTGDDHSTGETTRQGPKGSTPSLPATDHARWLRILDRALCGCFSLDCRVHGAYDCNDHKWVEAHRQKQEKPEWRPRHMDEGDDYVNEPRTGPVSDGPPGQEQKHEKGSQV